MDTQFRQTVLHGHSDFVIAIAFSSDGKTLATGSQDKTVRLWDLASQQCRATLEGHKRSVNTLAFSPCGTMLATGQHHGVFYGEPPPAEARLWDVIRGELRAILQGPNGVRGAHNALGFSPDGKMLTTGSVNLWHGGSRGNYLEDF